MVIAGGSGWTPEAVRGFARFVENWQLPIGLAFRFQDTLDNEHPNYAGDVGLGINPALAAAHSRCRPVACHRPAPGRIDDRRLHAARHPEDEADADPRASGRGRTRPRLRGRSADRVGHAGNRGIAGGVEAVVRHTRWTGSAEAAHRAYLEWRKPRPIPGDVQIGEIMQQLRAHLPDDAILTNGAGNYATWLHRHYSYRHFRSQLAPTSGAMGYGVPAAIAAKSLYPQRAVVALAGDGCFMMAAQELATAMQYDLHVMFIVVNNGQFGTIRMHQERHYPNRVHGTGLTNPDFAAFARSFGAHGETVERTEEFLPALQRAIAAKLRGADRDSHAAGGEHAGRDA